MVILVCCMSSMCCVSCIVNYGLSENCKKLLLRWGTNCGTWFCKVLLTELTNLELEFRQVRRKTGEKIVSQVTNMMSMNHWEPAYWIGLRQV